jgi:hypothetical protein
MSYRKSTSFLLLLIFFSLFFLGTLAAQEKKIVYTGHALDRMKERNITRPQVEETVRHADRRIFRKDERIQALKEFPQGVLKVIYVEEQTRYLIITTYWDKKRGNQL